MALGDDDIPGLLEEIGVPVSFTASGVVYEGYGFVREGDSNSFGTEPMSFTGKIRRVTLKSGAFPGLASGSMLTINGVTQQVVQVRQVYGGTLIEAFVPTV